MALAAGYANAASQNMVEAYVAQYGGSRPASPIIATKPAWTS